MLNIAYVLFLLMFLWAVVGMNLFGNIKLEGDQEISRRANFKHFPVSMLTLFRCMLACVGVGVRGWVLCAAVCCCVHACWYALEGVRLRGRTCAHPFIGPKKDQGQGSGPGSPLVLTTYYPCLPDTTALTPSPHAQDAHRRGLVSASGNGWAACEHPIPGTSATDLERALRQAWARSQRQRQGQHPSLRRVTALWKACWWCSASNAPCDARTPPHTHTPFVVGTT